MLLLALMIGGGTYMVDAFGAAAPFSISFLVRFHTRKKEEMSFKSEDLCCRLRGRNERSEKFENYIFCRKKRRKIGNMFFSSLASFHPPRSSSLSQKSKMPTSFFCTHTFPCNVLLFVL